VSDETEPSAPDDALLSRLRLIEDQALDERAPAYAALHDELLTTLEGSDARARP